MPVHVATQNYVRKEQDRFYVAQAEQKKNATAIIPKIKCEECLRPLELDDFSGKYKKRLPALIRQHGLDELAENGYVTCKMCAPQQKVEQLCDRCDIVKGLDDFSRSQLRWKERAVCMECAKEKAETEPLGLIAEEAKKEEWETDEIVASTSDLTITASTSSIPKRSKFWNSRSRFTSTIKSYSTSASSTVVGEDSSVQWGPVSSTNETSTESSASSLPTLQYSIKSSASSSPTLQTWTQSSASSSPTLQTSTDSSASSSPAVSNRNSSLSANNWIDVTTKRTNERRGQNNSYRGGRGLDWKGKSSPRGGRGGAVVLKEPVWS